MDAPIVEGYKLCRCGNLLPEFVLSRSANTCTECEGELFNEVRRLEVNDDGARYVIPINRSRTRRNSRENRQRRSTTQAARFAAMRRLKNLFPDLYGVLYAEERARRGLESFPVEGPRISAEGVAAQLSMSEKVS